MQLSVPASVKFMMKQLQKLSASSTAVLYLLHLLPELFAQANIDGGLVGGASLKPDFGKIVNYKQA